MARILRMPDTTELPDGPRREFVEELFRYYRKAGRPPLRIITDDIAETYDAFTASRETIRKMLRGKTVPVNWSVVDGVLTVLCARADIAPEAERWPHGRDAGYAATHRQHLRNLWDEALETPPPPARYSGPGKPGGWPTAANPYPDEPPF